MGLLQATEVIKLITGSGDPLIGALLMYDALAATTTELKVRRDPECPICSREPDEIGDDEMGVFPDYEAFCAAAGLSRVQPLSDLATIRIPPVLRPSVGGEREVSVEGANVGELLNALAEAHPETRSQLFGEDGELNRYVNVYLNDEDVRVLDGLDTGVGNGDVLVILRRWPAVHRSVTRSPDRPHRLQVARRQGACARFLSEV
jgi:molybdopterin converting factor small subunit